MGVGAAHVQPLAVTDGLDPPDVVPTVKLLALALADTVGDVGGLEEEAIGGAVGGADVGEVDLDEAVHDADVEGVPALVKVEGAGVGRGGLSPVLLGLPGADLSETWCRRVIT